MKLPEGWVETDEATRTTLIAELEKELPKQHLLANTSVRVVAYRKGTDDILAVHLDEPETLTVVHLSWTGQEELPDHPTVQFTGTHAEFMTWEYKNLRLQPPDAL